jgi:hypothetical protein
MIGKKINQLATELAPESTDLTIIGDPISGVSKKITLAQLGAIFSGAVSFYNDLASFPVSGDINVIYCAKDTQKLYLWTGSAYVEVFPSQALLDTYQLRSEKGNANGYASLDSGGKVPISQLPSSIMEYKGTWNAATNTPTLANGTGDTGDVYICNVAGTVNFGAGPITFAVGDYVIYSGTIWQRSSGAVGTVTSVAASITGDSVTISGSPVTTSGTLAFAFNGTTAQYIRGNGTLETFPSLTGFVPYTGATANVDLGTHTLIAAKGTFSSSGSGDTVGITHSSGSGIALNITKGGNGEGLYINKTSGSGNAATIIGTLNATSLVKSGGTSSQFLKADGSVDSSTYLTTSDASSLYLPLTGGTLTGLLSINSALRIKSGAANGVLLETYNTNQLVVRVTPSSTTYDSTLIFPSNSRNYTFPDASGTLALVGGSGVGTVTSVAALTIGTTGTDLSSTVANSTTTPVITLNVPTASATNRGALSSTDWTTFNNKQNALTNPITGISASGRVAYFNGDTSITGSSNFFWDATNNRLGIGLNNPQRTLEIHNATADSQLRISGAAPSVSLGEAITGAIYQAKFGLITANGQYVTGGVAGDFVMISQTGATIFATSSTEKMRVQASGNVSIGNTNDTHRLDVTGTGRFSDQVRINKDGQSLLIFPTTTSSVRIQIQSTGGGNMIIGTDSSTGGDLATGTNAYASVFSSGSIRDLVLGTNSVARLTINGTSGNVGIGTSSPNALLQVLGSSIIGSGTIANGNTFGGGGQVNRLKVESGNYTCLEINGNTSGGSIQFTYGSNAPNQVAALIGYNYAGGAANEFVISNILSGPLVFATNNTERMRLNSTGNLTVYSANATSIGAINSNNTNGNYGYYSEMGGNTNNTSSFHFVGAIAGVGNKIQICGNGNVQNTNNSYGAISDISLKENIIDTTSKLADLLKVKVRNYNLIGDDKKQIGVIAQELETIFPSMIDTDSITGLKSVKYSIFVPMLIKAIQELNDKIK